MQKTYFFLPNPYFLSLCFSVSFWDSLVSVLFFLLSPHISIPKFMVYVCLWFSILLLLLLEALFPPLKQILREKGKRNHAEPSLRVWEKQHPGLGLSLTAIWYLPRSSQLWFLPDLPDWRVKEDCPECFLILKLSQLWANCTVLWHREAPS